MAYFISFSFSLSFFKPMTTFVQGKRKNLSWEAQGRPDVRDRRGGGWRCAVCGQAGRRQRFGLWGWQAAGQDFRVGGVAHLTTFLRLALSVSPSLSWFEFFPRSILFMPSSHLHPPQDIKSWSWSLEVGRVGEGARLQGGTSGQKLVSKGSLRCMWHRAGVAVGSQVACDTHNPLWGYLPSWGGRAPSLP